MDTDSTPLSDDAENVELVDSESDEERSTEFDIDSNPTNASGSNVVGDEKNCKSIVRHHFTRQKVVIKGVTKKKALCQYCKKLYAADPNKNGTTSFRNHLYRCSRSPLFMGAGPKKSTLVQSIPGSPHIFNKKRLDLELVEWIVATELPFRIVNHPTFKIWVKDLCPRYFLPNRKKVAQGLWELYNLQKAKIMSVLRDIRVSITTNTWTSIQNVNYMVIISHLTDSNFMLHKRVINFCQITSHKGDDIGNWLGEMHCNRSNLGGSIPNMDISCLECLHNEMFCVHMLRVDNFVDINIVES